MCERGGRRGGEGEGGRERGEGEGGRERGGRERGEGERGEGEGGGRGERGGERERERWGEGGRGGECNATNLICRKTQNTICTFNERYRRREERSKQGQTNNKAKQHSTPKAVIFPKKNELPRVGLEPTTLYTTQSALPAELHVHVYT